MNRSLYHHIGLAVVSLLLTLCGCRRELDLEILADRTETLAVQIEGGSSRSAVNTSTGAMSWTSGDQIAVLTNKSTKTTTVDVSTGKVIVSLGSGEIRQGYAVYPASVVSTLTTSSVVVTYPASYDIRDNLSSENVPVPMVAENRSGTNSLTFRHVGGLLRISTTVPAGTSSVLVTMSGGYIAGNAVVTNPGAVDATSTITTGSNEVAFTVHSSGLASEETLTLNLPVPCGTYSGITIRAYNSSSTEIATYIDKTSRSIAHSRGIKLAVEMDDPVVVSSGEFSVSSTKKVYLAPGNLMAKIGSYSGGYPATASEWKFGEPWEYVGADASSGNYLFDRGNASCVGKWVDLFSWQGSSSTEAYRYHGLLRYDGGGGSSSYHGYYNSDSLYDGCWNGLPITNGGGYYWYPLLQGEWNYLFNSRSVINTLSAGARYTMATIGGSYKGIILFPDNYTHPDGTGFVAGTYNTYSNYTATVSLEGWALMQVAGCAFLPAAGWRRNAGEFNGIGTTCAYFTASPANGNSAYDLYYHATTGTTSDASQRNRGMTVRLARDVPSI